MNEKFQKRIVKRARQLSKQLHSKLHARHSAELDEVERVEIQRKLALLAEAQRSAAVNDSLMYSPTVFISYSSRDQSLLQKAIEEIENRGFSVLTGFDNQSERYVLKVVMDKIRESTLFLGLLTPKHALDLKNGDQKDLSAPSAWLSEEKGMALMARKPVRLLVDERVLKEYWYATLPDQIHSIYNTANFSDKLKEAIDGLERRYIAMLEEKLYEHYDANDFFDLDVR